MCEALSKSTTAIEQHTLKQKKRGKLKAKQPIKQTKGDQVLETTTKKKAKGYENGFAI